MSQSYNHLKPVRSLSVFMLMFVDNQTWSYLVKMDRFFTRGQKRLLHATQRLVCFRHI